jgi:hypothetical protein
MTVDDLLGEISAIGWSLRYLQQDWHVWAAMLYREQLTTPRCWGYTPTEALANAIEAIEHATAWTPEAFHAPNTRADLRELMNLRKPALKFDLDL